MKKNIKSKPTCRDHLVVYFNLEMAKEEHKLI